jgi:hypothetical protein
LAENVLKDSNPTKNLVTDYFLSKPITRPFIARVHPTISKIKLHQTLDSKPFTCDMPKMPSFRKQYLFLDRIINQVNYNDFSKALHQMRISSARFAVPMMSIPLNTIFKLGVKRGYHHILESILLEHPKGSLGLPTGFLTDLLLKKQFLLLYLSLRAAAQVSPSESIFLTRRLLEEDHEAFISVATLVHSKVSTEVSKAESQPLWESFNNGQLLIAESCVQTSSGFTGRELLMHALLYAKINKKSVVNAIKSLQHDSTFRLYHYIARVLKLYSQHQTLLNIHNTNKNMPFEVFLPPLAEVLDWSSSLIDINLPMLGFNEKKPHILELITTGVDMLLFSFRTTSRLKGAIDYLHIIKPLLSKKKEKSLCKIEYMKI